MFITYICCDKSHVVPRHCLISFVGRIKVRTPLWVISNIVIIKLLKIKNLYSNIATRLFILFYFKKSKRKRCQELQIVK